MNHIKCSDPGHNGKAGCKIDTANLIDKMSALSKKTLIAIFIFLSSCDIVECQIPKDKRDHLILGTAIGFGTSAITSNQPLPKSFLWSTVPAIVLSVGKELYDATGKGTPEWQDITYTAAGSIIGWGIVRGTMFLVNQGGRKKRNLAFTGNGLRYNF